MNKEELVAFLKDSLTIKVQSGGFTDPNSRTIVLLLDGEKIATASFDVVQKSEYEG